MDHPAFVQLSIFRHYPHLRHALTTNILGSVKKDNPERGNALQTLYEALQIQSNEVAFMQQVHGGVIQYVSSTGEEFRGVDGLVSGKKRVFLAVRTADCLPVLFYDPQRNIVGIAHAGFKGLLAGVLEHVIDEFSSLGSSIEDVLVGVGPGICGNCYDVTIERAKLFQDLLSNEDIVKTKDSHVFLDIRKVVFLLLVRYGIKPASIEISSVCTKESNEFYSYRKQGEKAGRFLSLIGML